MARSIYPSDHRRYFRVMEDILDDDGYRALTASEKVAWLDLLATFNRRKAHLTRNAIVLSWSAAMSIFSSRNRSGAVAKAAHCSRFVRASFAIVESGLLCCIPKWSKMQGLAPTHSVQIPSPTPTPTPTPTQVKKKGAPHPEKKVSKPRSKSLCPEFPSEEDGAKLISWGENHGFSSDQCRYAWSVLHDWSIGGGKLKVSWIAACRLNMRSGWLLDGYGGNGPPQTRDTRSFAQIENDRMKETLIGGKWFNGKRIDQPGGAVVGGSLLGLSERDEH